MQRHIGLGAKKYLTEFSPKRLWRAFLLAGITLAFMYLVVNMVAGSISINLAPLYFQDIKAIFFTILGCWATRFLYRRVYKQWLDYNLYGTIEDLRIGLRILSHTLLNAKSRHDLEAFVSWEMASDFGLRSAELALIDRPAMPYALQLPLTVSNLFLGTLFLGAKIDGNDFSKQELKVMAEVQKQVSLALWSIELDKAIQTTEQLTQLKGKFLANVTHELRTPLNGIINYIGFVFGDYKEELNQEQMYHVSQALRSAEKLLEIINNILDMSKIEVGQMTLNLQPTNLADIVAETPRFVGEMITDKPVEFITEVSPSLPNLYGDWLRLRQIIFNMLSNAAKFTQSGSIRLSVYPDNGNVIIKVADTGTGIDKKVMPTIFEQFISDGLLDAKQHAGPGLSMPITKSLVELHGGQVHVESHPGQGTTFTVTLPVKADTQNQEDAL